MAEEKKKPEKAGKKKKARKNPFKSIASFFKSVNSERKKVVWPTAKETLKNAAIVLFVTLIVGVAIYIVDTGLSLGLKGIKNLAPTTTTTSVSDSAEAGSESNTAEAGSSTDADAESGTGASSTESTTAGTTAAGSTAASSAANEGNSESSSK